MQIRILKPFTDPSTPIVFQPEECVTVEDAKAAKWIRQGYAVALDAAPNTDQPVAPHKRAPETASR
jgi:hypothetical protein